MKKNQGEISLSDSKTYYTATITKTVWCLRRDRHTDQCNETDNPETDPHKYNQLIFYQCAVDKE